MNTNSRKSIPMKSQNLIALALMALLFGVNAPSFSQESPEPFLGMWALTLDYEEENAGWLELTQEDGYLYSEILWRGGSVSPVDFTMMLNGNLLLVRGREVVRKRDESGNPVRTQHPIYWYDVKKDSEDHISGEANFPSLDGLEIEAVSFTGKRIPPAGEAPNLKKIKYGEAIELFKGKDLSGWELIGSNKTNGWRVEDGVLINDPVQKPGEEHINYGNLRTTASFEDFNLKVEVNVPAGSNSGVYLRGIYEVQVVDSYGKELDPHNMGALYSRITPLEAAEKPAGEWQEMDITLYKRHLSVIFNGKLIIDNQPVKGVTGGALTSDEFSPGPLYLQGDHGKVSYRKLKLTPILN